MSRIFVEAWDNSSAKQEAYEGIFEAALPEPIEVIVSIVGRKANCLHYWTRRCVEMGWERPLVVPVQRSRREYRRIDREGLDVEEIHHRKMSDVIAKRLVTLPVCIGFLDYCAGGYADEAVAFAKTYQPRVLAFTSEHGSGDTEVVSRALRGRYAPVFTVRAYQAQPEFGSREMDMVAWRKGKI